MSNYKGYADKIIKINLTDKTVTDYPFSDRTKELFLGGKILAAKILLDNIKAPLDPFSPDNIVVISTGPLTNLGVPSSSRYNISTISPLTGICVSSNCGGNFGMAMKRAGYDAVIITGRSEEKIYIKINNADITFENAEQLWGKTTGDTQAALGKQGAKLVIGPAGENLVRFAGVVNDERTAGRGGVGAVLGSKNVKGLLAIGTGVVEAHDKESLKELCKQWVENLKAHPLTGKQLPRLGTAGLLSMMNAKNLLATKNYSAGKFEGYEKVSGELLAEKHLVKNKGCITCPIQCARVVELDGKNVKGPEVETLGLLGPNILNNDLEKIIRWNYELDELGMDSITCASTIAFCMELNEKGLWDNGLEFGKTDGISELLHDIAYRRGIGDTLAEGSKRVSEIYGGKEFCMHSKGMELAAYEPRAAAGQGLGYAISNRGGCHLNGGYLVILEGLGLNINQNTPMGKAAFTEMFQDLMEAVSAAGNCLFTTYAFLPGFLFSKPNSFVTRTVNATFPIFGGMVSMAVKHPKIMSVNLKGMLPQPLAVQYATGIKMNMGRMLEIGKRGYNMERLLNTRLGISSKDDALPDRLTKVPQRADNPNSLVPLDKLKKKYYKVRQWDKDGIPKAKLIEKLQIIE